MAVKKNHKMMLKKLQKQVRLLQRKETIAKNRLRAALAKMRKLSRSYKSKLASKLRVMKSKIAKAQASTYADAAVHLERQLMKGIEAKGKVLASALNKIEKKYAAKLTKSISKKGKITVKVKKTRQTATVKMKKARGGKKK